jgi:hypothetical protein
MSLCVTNHSVTLSSRLAVCHKAYENGGLETQADSVSRATLPRPLPIGTRTIHPYFGIFSMHFGSRRLRFDGATKSDVLPAPPALFFRMIALPGFIKFGQPVVAFCNVEQLPPHQGIRHSVCSVASFPCSAPVKGGVEFRSRKWPRPLHCHAS